MILDADQRRQLFAERRFLIDRIRHDTRCLEHVEEMLGLIPEPLAQSCQPGENGRKEAKE